MHFFHLTLRITWIILVGVPLTVHAEVKTWTGYAGDGRWANPLNWSGGSVPQPSDEVLLDNGDLPISYIVNLPDGYVILKAIRIVPSPGRDIELILPSTNILNNALSVEGPGYGIDLHAGAIFRNSSGVTSGESIQIADSMIIRDGARYIHQTRAAHANGILRCLSTTPGTEQGIFDFDVPRASYTISLSNRIYGSLELHSGAFGFTVNYTCSGSNPLLVRGNIRIGPGVNLSMDLSGPNGNVRIDGDFIQEGGQLNLSSGVGDNTIMHIGGDMYQTHDAVITETSNGTPFIELGGIREQNVALAGRITNQIGFRMNNGQGAILNLPIVLPWRLEIVQGKITSSSASLLILDTGCTVIIDSLKLNSVYVNGPVKKLGLSLEDHFIFPVGKEDQLRWLELRNVTGSYTVEYFRQDPSQIGTFIGTGLHHISKREYWSISPENVADSRSKIELSFTSTQSGGVTNPDFLRVAKFESGFWQDGGNSATTGNGIQGSVLSLETDFSAVFYTLASSVDDENPLPFVDINLNVNEVGEQLQFIWAIHTDLTPDHFDLYEETSGTSTRITSVKCIENQIWYNWSSNWGVTPGNHYFRIKMVDIHGQEYAGKIIEYKKVLDPTSIMFVPATVSLNSDQILIYSSSEDNWTYEIYTTGGQIVEAGNLKLSSGKNLFRIDQRQQGRGIRVFRGTDSKGKTQSLLMISN